MPLIRFKSFTHSNYLLTDRLVYMKTSIKIVEFRGGLGNQMFSYAYCEYLRRKYPHSLICGFYPKCLLSDHNGLEIDKCFHIDMPPRTHILVDKLLYHLSSLNRWHFGPRGWRMPFLATDTHHERWWDFFHEGLFQDPDSYPVPGLHFDYRLERVTSRTAALAEKMGGENAVGIHVRRGDFLNAGDTFIGICTEAYYHAAMAYVKSRVEHPVFYFFSDDPEWVRTAFHEEGMTVVDWNTGTDSFLDMYLMSQCRALVIANSTFSYWAAQNSLLHPLVCCPTRWNNLSGDHSLVRPGWVRISPEGEVMMPEGTSVASVGKEV